MCRETVVTSQMPSPPIQKGLPGPGLLANVLVSKYGDHTPLYRQEEIYARDGIELCRKTLCDGVKDSARLLEPVVEWMRRDVLRSGVLQTDDTPVPVQDRSREGTRQEKSRPILDEFYRWLCAQKDIVLPKSPMGEAIGYALGQWEALIRYIEDGRLEIDNNAAERELRPIAIGRKNYLFVGSDGGGRSAAIICSLIRTCKRHGIDPFAYLRDVLERIPDHPINRIEELTPLAWKQAQAKS